MFPIHFRPLNSFRNDFEKNHFFQFFEKFLENFLENLKNHESHLKCSRIRSKMFFDMKERAFNSWGVALQLTRVCKTKWTEENSFRRPECSMSYDFDVLEVVLHSIEHSHYLKGILYIHFSLQVFPTFKQGSRRVLRTFFHA